MIEAQPRGDAASCVPRNIGDVTGERPAPTLIVVGGLHANEPAGIEAAQRVHNSIDDGRLHIGAGRLVSLRGNLGALAAEAAEPWLRDRYIHEDLNRVFHEVDDAPADASAERSERAQLADEITSIVQAARGDVYLLDLHTVSSDSPAFIALEDSLPARRFAQRFPLPKILGMEEELRGLLIDYATSELGCVSCIVEAGRHDEPRSTDVHEAVILLALISLGIASAPAKTSTGESPHDVVEQASGGRGRRFYDVRQRVPIERLPFRMQPGATAFMPVTAEQTIVAMDGPDPVTPGANGLLFMPNRQASPRVGDDAFFVVAPVGRVWLSVSAGIRRRALVHRVLPILMPGVRRREGDPHALLVAPEYAAVLRREVLHLLGYRLIRWSHTPYLARRRRITRVISGTARAFLQILHFAPRGGEHAALPQERETDWIARRRRLDILASTRR